MKKTYKPLARTEKASQMFKKKTLNVHDALNIRHDDDDIENVDDYWNTAVSVIGNSTIDSIDHSTLTEMSDTLFNIKTIRQSIKNSKTEKTNPQAAVHDENFSLADESTLIDLSENCGLDDSIRPDATNNRIGEEVSIVYPQTDNNIERIQEEDIRKENKPRIVETPVLDNLYENTSNVKDLRTDSKYNRSSADNTNSKEINPITRNNTKEALPNVAVDSEDHSEISPNLFQDDAPFDVSEQETRFSPQKVKTNPEMPALKTFPSAKKSQVSKTAVEKHIPQKRAHHSFVIEQAQGEPKKNSIAALVCSSSMDTALMSLDYLAYFNDFKTEYSFSVYVIKGKVNITVNGKLKTASKGECTIIERDDVYSLDCVSQNGAELFLSYAL